MMGNEGQAKLNNSQIPSGSEKDFSAEKLTPEEVEDILDPEDHPRPEFSQGMQKFIKGLPNIGGKMAGVVQEELPGLKTEERKND